MKNPLSDVEKRLICSLIATVDCLYLPFKRGFDHRRRTLIYEGRRGFEKAGVPFGGAAIGMTSAADSMASSRAMRSLADADMIELVRTASSRTVGARPTSRGDEIGRALAGLPRLAQAMKMMARLAKLAQTPLAKDAYEQTWTNELVLCGLSPKKWGKNEGNLKAAIFGMEDALLPALWRGFVVSECDAGSEPITAVWYALTSKGREAIAEPIPTFADVPEETDVNAVSAYHNTLKHELDKLSTATPKRPNEIGSLPLPVSRGRPGCEEAWKRWSQGKCAE